MATEHDADDNPQDTGIDLNDVEPDDATPGDADDPPASPSPAAATPPAPATAVHAATAAAQPGNLAELSAQLRQEAAEITEIAAQAGRLGIAIDAAKALREGTTPEALRSLVLQTRQRRCRCPRYRGGTALTGPATGDGKPAHRGGKAGRSRGQTQLTPKLRLDLPPDKPMPDRSPAAPLRQGISLVSWP